MRPQLPIDWDEARRMERRGMTRREVARVLAVHPSTVYRHLGRRMPPGRAPAVLALHQQGLSYRQIAAMVGVSHQRVAAIVAAAHKRHRP